MPDIFDVIALLGLALLGYGLYLVSLPLALSVVGVIVLAFGLWGAVSKGASR